MVSRRTQFSSSALPPEGSSAASPKAISRRTSYHRVRLEFLSYPQLIPAFCTARGFGPPPDFHRDSSWSWVAHPVSCYVCATNPPKADMRPIQTRFPYASRPMVLKQATQTHSQAHSSIGIPSPLRAPAHCRHTVSETISSPSPGCFSPFPRGTGPLSITIGI